MESTGLFAYLRDEANVKKMVETVLQYDEQERIEIYETLDRDEWDSRLGEFESPAQFEAFKRVLLYYTSCFERGKHKYVQSGEMTELQFLESVVKSLLDEKVKTIYDIRLFTTAKIPEPKLFAKEESGK